MNSKAKTSKSWEKRLQGAPNVCLESYRDDTSRAARVLVVGIDGNEAEDMQMIAMAEKVFGVENTPTIPLHEPFGQMATRMISDWKRDRLEQKKGRDVSEDECHDHVLEVLVRQATSILQDCGQLHHAPGRALQPICVCQPHRSKKEIMFSSLLFTLALARANNLPFIWSSDSDSILHTPAAPIHRVLAAMSADDRIAGSCGALQIHNAAQSTVTRLVAATYWTDLSLTSGQNSAFDVTDCQPGPCAAFRAAALASILVPWHAQTFLGARPVVNEDRHLTTRLLLRGHKVTFNPAATVLTDAPATLAAWVVQQVRWSRAIVLETLAHPRALLVARSPVLALYALRRVAGPYLQAWIVVRYLCAGRGTAVTSPADIAARILLCSAYTLWRNRGELGVAGGGGGSSSSSSSARLWPWLVASQVFLQFPQPPIVFWACATFLDGSWGSPVKCPPEKVEAVPRRAFRKNLAPLLCVAVWVALVGAAVSKYLAGVVFVGYGVERFCASVGAMVAGSSMFYLLVCGY
ncbi:glycosyltransferase family 2 protein [Neofusicoccum parvum]|nr:glycosyltransferase family 2 protein [Neofusicoccum parvum]